MYEDPAKNMALARWLASVALGTELPPDAEVEIAHDKDGVVHVRGSVVLKGVVPAIECGVKFVSGSGE